MCYTADGHEVRGAKIKNCLTKAHQQELRDKVEGEKWQGKLTKSRWEDDSLKVEECFAWLHHWKTTPTHTIVGAHELYQQLLPTRIFYSRKTGTNTTGDERCRLCGKGPESVQHILAGCSALAQTKYLERHNSALKILFFEVLRSLDLIDTEELWHSRINPKPMYENERATAYWDAPLHADSNLVTANRIDATIVDKGKRKVSLIELPVDREPGSHEAEVKATKYAPLRAELKERYPGYHVTQYNIIIDVLGGYSREVKQSRS